jgi:hypothetical protein
MDGGKWVWWFGLALLVLISGFRQAGDAGRNPSDPFGSVEMVDWRLPDPWRYPR